MSSGTHYRLVQLGNGTRTVRSITAAETFHPGIGPQAEAEALYVDQLRLSQRCQRAAGDFVIWDVGLGAGANALAAVKRLGEESGGDKALRLFSFDQTPDALGFALAHAGELGYLSGFEPQIDTLLSRGCVEFMAGRLSVYWQFCQGDFPLFLAAQPPGAGRAGDNRAAADVAGGRDPAPPPPHAILFDPYSPHKNPAMWSVALFTALHRALDPARPCLLANYTRSTLARTAMLLGGFFVGAGRASGAKVETTVAASHLDLIENRLDQRWLDRAMRSDSAEPVTETVNQRVPLTPETRRRLLAHPQFQPSAPV